jgi:hypothetical protein
VAGQADAFAGPSAEPAKRVMQFFSVAQPPVPALFAAASSFFLS